MNEACPNETGVREPLKPDATREQVLEALRELQAGYDELRRGLEALEERVARQERRAAADTRGGGR